jgi:cytoskeletal protein CcmA (bactofilin family)
MKPPEGSTTIGRSVIIRGELFGKEDLFMDGVVEGTILLPESRLTVGPNARVKADLGARVVKGDIVAERLSIEENASIKGKVELTEVATTGSPVAQRSTDLFGASVSAPPLA